MPLSLALLKPFAPWLGAGAFAFALGWQGHRLATAGAVEAARKAGYSAGAAYQKCLADLARREADLAAREEAQDARDRIDAVRPDDAARRLSDGTYLLSRDKVCSGMR